MVRYSGSEKAAKAALVLSSGSAHTDVWDKAPATKEAQLMATKEAGEPLLRAFESDVKETTRMAEAKKRRGLCSITLAGIVGLLTSCSTSARAGVMRDEAARRRVSFDVADWQLMEQMAETSELQYLVLREHD